MDQLVVAVALAVAVEPEDGTGVQMVAVEEDSLGSLAASETVEEGEWRTVVPDGAEVEAA